ncbi:hypothetical protein [Amycolatopsis magusensis]|uniref:hypothetical protein n=1 Tax=Amycolatopsis magusensis TaxID=882444 RepID=UPI0037BCE8E0
MAGFRVRSDDEIDTEERGGANLLRTSADIRALMQQTVEAQEGEYDVRAIADELIATYDLTGESPAQTLEDITEDEFWTIVLKHDRDGNGAR